jgi:ABC-type multidrug transport system fused ATPase/permease subunit
MIFLLSILLATVFFYVRFVKPGIRSYGEKITFHGEGLIRSINQSLGALKEIRVLNVENTFFNAISNAAKGSSESQTGFYSLMLIPRYLIEIVFVIFLVAYSFYISYYHDGPEYLISSLAVMGIAGMRMLPSITGISSSLATMNYSTHALTKLYDDLKSIEGKVAIDFNADRPLNLNTEAFKTLSIQNICYSYPKAKKNAIHNLTIELHKGDSIGLVGKSGSGKTTLVDLLLGLYSVSDGNILFNNKTLDESNLNSWLSQVAYIPQSPFLLDATLAENIAFGVFDQEVDKLQVYKAIEQAQLTEVLARLPDGISSKLGERGIKLSGGECQRVAIARAFYHNRNVFIFDEATSALDAETENNVVEMIESLHGKKTMIVIAHRLSTVRHCDKIYKLENGSVISSGKFSEVFS